MLTSAAKHLAGSIGLRITMPVIAVVLGETIFFPVVQLQLSVLVIFHTFVFSAE